MKKHQPRISKRARLHDILGRYGDGLITREEFEEVMRDHKLTDEDIDRYLRGELE